MPRNGRSPWNRRRDRVFAALIVVVCLGAAVAVWSVSDQRGTVQRTAAAPAPRPPAPGSVPGALTEMWSAASPATPVPVAQGPTVVSAEGGEVLGRDAVTGEVRWRYARDLELCTVALAWKRVLVVHRKELGCSEVTQLDPDTGRRTAQRNSDAELGTRLVDGRGQVTTTGRRLLVSWRDDLVKTNEYGEVPALVNPGRQPRTGCTYGSVAATSGRIGVVERCPEDPGDRLTVLKAVPEKSDKPEQVFTAVLAGRDAKVVAMSGDHTAVVLPEQRLLVIYGAEGDQRAAYPLDLPAADLGGDPKGGVVPTNEGAVGMFWFTGSTTVALSRSDLTPLWTLRGTLGPGTRFAGQYVLPIEGGLAVVDEGTGATVRTVGVDRHGYAGPVRLDSTGPVVLEQRGDQLAALK
ncbi:PQQ-binding-like beta-propeller repeat protein [Amycolatopsis arida]|uniref:Rv3212 family protein n=1 Tax=Amycolatopsis arida TaxID=587909 RepID=UPI000B873A6F|nr:PQQ-binding-like beta-propeller repeat protein [Amycolatopsis arida]